MQDGVLATFSATVLEFDKETKNGRIYPSELKEQLNNDIIIQEQLNTGGIPIPFEQDNEISEVDVSKIAAYAQTLTYNEKENLMEINGVVLDTPQGKLLNEFLNNGVSVSITVTGKGDLEMDTEKKAPIVKNYSFDGLRAYGAQKIWKKNISNYKKIK